MVRRVMGLAVRGKKFKEWMSFKQKKKKGIFQQISVFRQYLLVNYLIEMIKI